MTKRTDRWLGRLVAFLLGCAAGAVFAGLIVVAVKVWRHAQ